MKMNNIYTNIYKTTVHVNGLKASGIKNKQAWLSIHESTLLIGPLKRTETLHDQSGEKKNNTLKNLAKSYAYTKSKPKIGWGSKEINTCQKKKEKTLALRHRFRDYETDL